MEISDKQVRGVTEKILGGSDIRKTLNEAISDYYSGYDDEDMRLLSKVMFGYSTERKKGLEPEEAAKAVEKELKFKPGTLDEKEIEWLEKDYKFELDAKDVKEDPKAKEIASKLSKA